MIPTAKKQPKQLQPADMFIGINFDSAHADLQEQMDWEKASALLNEKKMTVKDGGSISYRLINHWASAGLFEEDREDPSKGWRKLSYKDVIWLRVIRDLRSFGLPLEKISQTYQSLFMKNGRYSSRDFELALILCSNEPPSNFFIIVFESGDARIATLENLWYNEAVNGYAAPYIRISLNALVCEAVGSDRHAPEKVHPVVLTGEEIDILGSFREAEFDEMRIRMKDGAVDQIDKSKAIRDTQRISDLLKETRFGEIKLRVEDGKVVYTQHTKKDKR